MLCDSQPAITQTLSLATQQGQDNGRSCVSAVGEGTVYQRWSSVNNRTVIDFFLLLTMFHFKNYSMKMGICLPHILYYQFFSRTLVTGSSILRRHGGLGVGIYSRVSELLVLFVGIMLSVEAFRKHSPPSEEPLLPTLTSIWRDYLSPQNLPGLKMNLNLLQTPAAT